MNTCLICGKIQDEALLTCDGCGEASFRFGPQSAPVAKPSAVDEPEPKEPAPSFSRKRRK